MITKENLLSNFIHVREVSENIFEFRDVLPKKTLIYYLRIATENFCAHDLLVVSENNIDDEFAILIFSEKITGASSLQKKALANNKYGFSTLVLAPAEYHAYFKGRLDGERKSLLLCLPTYNCEFSGLESTDDFCLMRREIVSTLDWNRKISPKISLRFDHPSIEAGTGGNAVLARYEMVLNEINNLDGARDAFVEISNYLGENIEILSHSRGEFILVRKRDDRTREYLDADCLMRALWKFLTD